MVPYVVWFQMVPTIWKSEKVVDLVDNFIPKSQILITVLTVWHYDLKKDSQEEKLIIESDVGYLA